MRQEHGAPALGWIEQTALATAMRQDIWLYPAVEIAHIWGFVLLVGSIAMLDLRLLGLTRQVSVRQLSRGRSAPSSPGTAAWPRRRWRSCTRRCR